MSVIKVPFGFLEVGKEGIGADASQSGQTGFGIAPERFNAIDMAASPGEFIGTMVNPIMFVAFENQAVVSAPPVGENDAFVDRRDVSLNHLEEFSFRTIRQGGTDVSSPSFEKTDNRDFPSRSASANATNPSWSEVAFIHFHTPSKRRCLGIGQFHNPPTEQTINAMGCVLIDLGQAARFERFHIGAEELQN
jgi:hypothetical protein